MKLKIANVDANRIDGAYPAPYESEGVLWSSTVIDDNLRLIVAELSGGAWLRWPPDHGEEAVYVMSGALAVDGYEVPAGGAVISRGRAALGITAVGTTQVAHFSAPGYSAHRDHYGESPLYHLIGPAGRYRSGSAEKAQAWWFADSTCPDCQVTLMRVERSTANRGPSHSHSCDEIIFVTSGDIRFGSHHLGPGGAVLVPSDTRYAVTAGEYGYTFLNYRPRASMQNYGGERPAEVENGLGRGGVAVMDIIA